MKPDLYAVINKEGYCADLRETAFLVHYATKVVHTIHELEDALAEHEKRLNRNARNRAKRRTGITKIPRCLFCQLDVALVEHDGKFYHVGPSDEIAACTRKNYLALVEEERTRLDEERRTKSRKTIAKSIKTFEAEITTTFKKKSQRANSGSPESSLGAHLHSDSED